MELKFGSSYQLARFAERAIAANKESMGAYGTPSNVATEYELEEANTAAITALKTLVDLTNEQSCRSGKLEQAATIAVSDFVRKMTGKEEENAPLTVEESKAVREMLEKANATEDEVVDSE